jgi:hypothetical protein
LARAAFASLLLFFRSRWKILRVMRRDFVPFSADCARDSFPLTGFCACPFLRVLVRPDTHAHTHPFALLSSRLSCVSFFIFFAAFRVSSGRLFQFESHSIPRNNRSAPEPKVLREKCREQANLAVTVLLAVPSPGSRSLRSG